MRRLFVCVVVMGCFGSLVDHSIASASTNSTSPVVDPSRDYWLEAQTLAQNHLVLLNRIERSLSSSDVDRLRALKGQIFLQTSAIERFLKSSYPVPEVLCASNSANSGAGSVAGTDAVSLEEAQVYCALYLSARDLQPLKSQLDRRSGMVAAASTSVQPLSSVSDRSRLTVKTATPVLPAIQPPEESLAIVQTSRDRLLQVQSAFPVTARFVVPAQATQSQQAAYDLYPQESQPYTSFLSQPNTGITRLLPSEVYRTASNALENRLAPTVAEQLPFATLMRRSDGLSPRLAIQVEGGNFQIVPTDLDYGFMTDLGEVAIETLVPPSVEALPNLSDALQFFYNYRPPSELEAIQVDRRRFASEKGSNLNLSQATAVLNRTYLVRSIQFKVPEIITSGRSLLPRERLSLKDLLDTPSSDLLFAFRPVSRRADGSYTVLWKVLRQFSNPQIRDLDRYVVK